MAPYLVIFDCDGTLIDSQHRISASMRGAYEACGLAPPPPEKTRTVIGMSLELAIARLSPDLAETLVHQVAEAYKTAFCQLRQQDLHAEPMYDGAREVLDWLKAQDNVLLGIATGKSRRGLDAVLQREQLQDHFLTLQTADDAPSKPHPGMVQNALRETGAEISRCLVVGDTSFDMEMAVNAGVRALGVSWGYHSPQHLRETGAYDVLDSYAALPAALTPLLAGRNP